MEMMVVDALAWTTASILLYFDRLCYLFCCLQVAKAVEMMVVDALAWTAASILLYFDRLCSAACRWQKRWR